MILFWQLNFCPYKQYESHTFMRNTTSCGVNLPSESLTLDATLNGILAKQPTALLLCMCLSLFIYFQSVRRDTRWHRCPHSHTIFTYVIFVEQKLLWERNSLNFVLNSHSCCALSVGFLNVYSIPVCYKCVNPWQVHPRCIIVAGAVLYPILFLFQI